jgi:hypothetical protein
MDEIKLEPIIEDGKYILRLDAYQYKEVKQGLKRLYETRIASRKSMAKKTGRTVEQIVPTQGRKIVLKIMDPVAVCH